MSKNSLPACVGEWPLAPPPGVKPMARKQTSERAVEWTTDFSVPSPNKKAVMSRAGTGMADEAFPPGDVDTDQLRFRLAKTEEEIESLREALLSKEESAADLRRQLGLGPLENLKHNLSKGWQDVRTSSAYVRASAVLEDIGNTDASRSTSRSRSRTPLVRSNWIAATMREDQGRPGPRRPRHFFYLVRRGRGHHQETGTDESSAASRPATPPRERGVHETFVHVQVF
ncbi:uncharacterized protein LOC144195915 isoform X1 [Stigmatopora nigra]